MSWITKLERRLGGYAIPNLWLLLIIGQGLMYVAAQSGIDISRIVLHPAAIVEEREIHRLFTWIFVPEFDSNIVFAFFFLYVFFLTSSALEGEWGAFRYNLYLLIGFVLTVIGAFVWPPAFWGNTFVMGSVFVAFAWRFPNVEFLMFFVLPVKVKWLGLLAWAFYALLLLRNPVFQGPPIVAGLLNFFIFFGPEFKERIVAWRRRTAFKRDAETARRDFDADDDDDD